MQCMVYTSHDSSLPGAMLEVAGDLTLRQKWPLGNQGIDTRYNVRMPLVMLFIAHQHSRLSSGGILLESVASPGFGVRRRTKVTGCLH